MTRPAVLATRLLEAAFKLGADIVEANQGFHFIVHMEGGHTLVGCPEDYADDGLLMLDCVGGSPTPIIDIHKIVAITVIEV